MNKLTRHFFFSALESQIGNEVRKLSKVDLGKLISISFIVTKEKTIQRVKFEKKEGDSELTDAERKGFASTVGIDIEKELSTCKSIFCMVSMEKKKIFITYNYETGEPKNITI